MPDKDGKPVEPVCNVCGVEAGAHHYWCPLMPGNLPGKKK